MEHRDEWLGFGWLARHRTSEAKWPTSYPPTFRLLGSHILVVKHFEGKFFFKKGYCRRGVQKFLKEFWEWCPVKDSNLQLSVSKTAASTNFANWTWWGWMDLNQLCPKTNRFTVCRASPSAPHPHVRGSISFGLSGWIWTSGLLLPRQAVYRTDNTPRGYGRWKIKSLIHSPKYISKIYCRVRQLNFLKKIWDRELTRRPTCVPINVGKKFLYRSSLWRKTS